MLTNLEGTLLLHLQEVGIEKSLTRIGNTKKSTRIASQGILKDPNNKSLVVVTNLLLRCHLLTTISINFQGILATF